MLLALMTSFVSTSYKSNDPMTGQKLLVANRGEIAIRIFRSAADLGVSSIAIYPADDSASLHVEKADAAIVLPGRGVAAYLDGVAILRVAREAGATAIHPGYGFLSENAAFARACAEAGITFVGPTPETLDLFGDKHRARQFAHEVGVPTLPGTEAPTTPEKARAFMEGLGAGAAVMVKAVAGGGGRGMRPVLTVGDLEEAFARCRSEATAAFGSGDLYVEQLVRQARHIEVQVIGDGAGVAHLLERDCSLQRQRQKLVEFAPAPNLDAQVRQQLLDAALMMAGAANYRSLGTFEFLVDSINGAFYFIEANPRLQVEHTVTEAVTGLDLVELQLRLAGGATLAELGLAKGAGLAPRGMAMQLRINVETMQPDGTAKPGGGVLSTFEPPSGPDIRVDGYGYAGYATNPAYDSLLAKLIVFARSGSVDDVTGKGYRALCEFNVAGAPTNIAFLQALLSDKHVRAGNFDTGFVAANAPGLLAVDAAAHPRLYATVKDDGRRGARAGAKVDATDPLSVLTYGQSTSGQPVPGAGPAAGGSLQDGMIGVRTPMQGTVISVAVSIGDAVPLGVEVAVMEAMKMEHVIKATASGIVRAIHVEPGETLWEDQLLLSLEPSEIAVVASGGAEEVDLDHVRPDLAEYARASRPDARREAAGVGQAPTAHDQPADGARESRRPGRSGNSFVEYGPFAIASTATRGGRSTTCSTRRRRPTGSMTGVGRVNGSYVRRARAQRRRRDGALRLHGAGRHPGQEQPTLEDRQDPRDRREAGASRWCCLHRRRRRPAGRYRRAVGGRLHHSSTLSYLRTAERRSRRSIGIVSGRCFAGNAVAARLLRRGDRDGRTTTLGMGGPAMIEGGNLGVFSPEESRTHERCRCATVSSTLLVADEAEAIAVAKRYLAYFQGALTEWTRGGPARAAAPSCRRTGCACTRCATSSPRCADEGFGAGSCAATLGARWSRR
jgi:acetyl/propionyl-CoA carboxylase alpha subunit